MKKITNIFNIFFLIIIAVGCNKKKTVDPVAPPNNTTSTNQTGLFELFRSQYFDGTNYVTAADYINLTFINYNLNPFSSTEVNAGNVSFNGTGLAFDGYSYEDTTYTINYTVPAFTINVSGSSQIDAFTKTFNPFYPSFTGDALLPTTVSKSTGFSMNLGSSMVNVTDTSTIQLFNSSLKKIAPGQASVTFTPTDLMGVIVGNGYTFELELLNNQTFNINGKTYNVRNTLQYTKYNVDVVP